MAEIRRGWIRYWALAGLIGGLGLGFAGHIPALAQNAKAASLDSEAGLYLSASQAERISDFPVAADLMNRLLEQHPDDLRLRRRAFLAALAAGDKTAAIRHAAALRAAGDRALPLAPLTEAVAALSDGKAGEAATLLDSANAVGLERFALPFAEAWISLAEGKTAEALSALDNAGLPEGTEALIAEQAASILLLAKDPVAAEARIKSIAEDSAALPLSTKRLYARVLVEQGRAGEARSLLEQAASDGAAASRALQDDLAALGDNRIPAPMVRDPASGLALAFQTIGSFAQRQSSLMALRYHRLALMLDPGLDLSWLGVASVLQERQQYTQASAALQNIGKDSPFRFDAQLEIVANLQAAKQDDAAIKAAEALAKEYPARFEPYMQIGTIERLREEWSDAVSAYDKAVKRVGTPDARHWRLFYFRGIAHERNKDWDEAEADFKKALQLEPEQPYVLNYLAYSWVDRGINIAEAKAMIKRAVAREYDSGAIVDSLGWVLYRIGEYDEAVKELERAIQLEPGDPTINDHLGDAYWMVGRKIEAEFQWKRALNLNPEDDIRAVIEKKLKDGMEPPKIIKID